MRFFQSFCIFLLGLIFLCSGSWAKSFPSGSCEVSIPVVAGVRSDLLKNIAPIIQKSIKQGNYPGAVVLAGKGNQIIYRGVFGSQSIEPKQKSMRFNTIFDLASLTKVLVTAPAIMQLLEQGKINLDTPVAKYWPDFAKEGKGRITVRQLLTHTSGLPAGLSLPANASSQTVFKAILALKLKETPGKTFLYSDLNFVVLAHLVEMISGKRLNQYANQFIFKPLNMRDTSFLPPDTLRNRIAPTEKINKKLRWGKVHDPLASAMGGVSGNAGLFATANDLSLFVRALLNGGKLHLTKSRKQTSHFLGPLAIAKMTTRQTPDHILDMRGFGWDMDSLYTTRGVLFPVQSFGHTGWTGTSIWIDPVTKTWLIILSSRAHPSPAKNNQLTQDRRLIANIIAASIAEVPSANLNNTSQAEMKRAF